MTLTQEELKREIDYNYRTGTFRWKTPKQKRTLDKEIGTIDKVSHYVRITLKGYVYYAHRLAFLYHYGYVPNEIDHINGDRTDNRIANLREVSRKENLQNNPRTRGGEIAGVYETKSGKYKATAYHPLLKKTQNIGTFTTRQEATQAKFQREKEIERELEDNRDLLEARDEVQMYMKALERV